MAILEESFQFTGSLGKLSAYRMKGSDKIIVRRKGGPTKKMILTSPKFDRLREHMCEFTGVGKAVSAVRFLVVQVSHLAGYNYTPRLTIICKKIQGMDSVSDRGERNVYLSRYGYMLTGFKLNEKHPFQGIVTGPVTCVFNRETKSARIQLPWLLKGINLHLPWKQPLYRFVLSLSSVPDITLEKASGNYDNYHQEWYDAWQNTAWHVAVDPYQSETVELKLDFPGPLKDNQALFFSIGIEMGEYDPYGKITSVEKIGSACIMAIG